MALGDQLRADDDVELALGNRRELEAHARDPADHVAGKGGRARIGEAGRHLLRQPLDPGPDRRQAFRVAAVGTRFRPLLEMAAVVAHQHAAKAVLHQPRRAVGTLEAVAAGAAERQRCVATPIEEEEHLLLVGKRLADRLHQRRRQEPAALGLMLAEVDRVDLGQRRRQVPFGERDAPVAPGVGVDAALDRWRRRRQHHRKAGEVAAHHRHVAGGVEHALLLLVGEVVLLVDDDQAEVLERQEQRRPGPDHHLRGALGDAAPYPFAPARRHV